MTLTMDRAGHFVNTFGEHVIVEQVEDALATACRRAHADVVAFTVAPRYPGPGVIRGGHEWLVEFGEPPRAPALFAPALDEALQRASVHYRIQRAALMDAPRVLELPAGTFHRWTVAHGRRSLAPRVSNDRGVADALLAAVAARGAVPLRVSAG